MVVARTAWGGSDSGPNGAKSSVSSSANLIKDVLSEAAHAVSARDAGVPQELIARIVNEVQNAGGQYRLGGVQRQIRRCAS